MAIIDSVTTSMAVAACPPVIAPTPTASPNSTKPNSPPWLSTVDSRTDPPGRSPDRRASPNSAAAFKTISPSASDR